MKLTLIFSFLIFSGVWANSYSQTSKLTLDLKNATVREFIEEIEKRTDFYFIYQDKVFRKDQRLNIKVEDESLDSILKQFEVQAGIKAELIEHQIIIKQINPEITTVVSEQQKKLIGVVTDEKGLPLPGVSVVVKGTTIGTVTTADGRFNMDVPADTKFLQLSFVGMKPMEVSVEGKSNLTVVMEEESIGLGEVVAIGYGTVRKVDLTGSVASISSDELKNLPVSGVNQALMGKAAGVNVKQESGHPGAGFTVRIRGNNSLQGSNEPLYVVDGMPFDGSSTGGSFSVNPLSTLNSSDIESVQILKDASATAIYGARGANGVVIITTKGGKTGAPKISLDSYFGMQYKMNGYETVNGKEFIQFYNESILRNTSPVRPAFTQDEINSFVGDTDWVGAVTRTAPIQSYQVAIDGGTEKVKYYVSGNYFDQKGIIQNSGFKRYNVRANIDAQLTDKLKLGFNLNNTMSVYAGNFGDDSGIGYSSSYIFALEAPPITPIYDKSTPDGYSRSVATTIDNFPNPVEAVNEQIRDQKYYRSLFRAFAEYEIIKGLKYKLNVAADISSNQSQVYLPKSSLASQYLGQASKGSGFNRYGIMENTISYDKEFGGHKINAVAGYTAERSIWQGVGANASSFSDDALSYNNLGKGDPTKLTASAYEGERALISYLGRVNYSYKGKYYLTISGREDGSSVFGKNNKWGFFPSGAIAWRISEEDFIKNNIKIDNLKLRYSYGSTGSQAIAPYGSLNKAGIKSNVSTDGNNLNIIAYQSAMGNPNLRWETTTQSDVGFDLGIFNNRLNITADYFYKKTTDLLFDKQYPSIADDDNQITENVGSMENRGIDLNINGVIVSNHNWNWSSSFNFGWVKNKILDLGTDALGNVYPYLVLSPTAGRADVVGADQMFRITKVGEAMGVFYLPIYEGIVANEEQRLASGYFIDDIGVARYRDINKDGKINSYDRVITGNAFPDFTGGFSSEISYKNIDLSLFFDYSIGNEILNLTKYALENSRKGWTITKDYFNNRWVAGVNETTATAPRADRSISLSTRYLEDGSFLRLRNLTLGYRLPSSVIKPMGISNIRIYVTGSNLFYITKYSGTDPDVNIQGSSNLGQGLDYSAYPSAKSFIVGVSMTF